MQLSEIIGSSFVDVHKDIKAGKYIHYWFNGGRGSLKSSTIAIEMVLGIMKDPTANGVALRKVKDTLHGSVFEQLVWGIEKLGVTHLWNIPKSQLELTYLPTGQKIAFRGADNPKKIKSIKFSKGYCKFIWYEELDEFTSASEIRMINQSLMRGGKDFVVFYSYNPPKSINNWVNIESKLTRPDRLVHHSDYRTVPREWLGEQFIIEAEHLRDTNYDAYAHEYLGEVTGTGGEVFKNIEIDTITDEQIKDFEVIRRGLDFGFVTDPLHYCTLAYNRKLKKIYIFGEFRAYGMSNYSLVIEIKKENKNNDLIYADSAEPKSISEMNQLGLRVGGVKKGRDSVEYGIKFLQDLDAIVIDDARCPETAREFMNYEIEKDANGNFRDEFPDKDNHAIDSVRYALNYECLNHRPEKIKKESKFAINSLEYRIEKNLERLTKKNRNRSAIDW